VESRNVTHLGERFPVFWREARGVEVVDADGNVYLDFTGAFGVALAGHGHPAITRAITDQAGRLVHGMGDVHPTEIRVRLLERLVALGPWRGGRAVLASSGSEAVEIGLKTAILASGRPGILAFRGAYHGLTLGSLATTHRRDFREPFESRLFRDVEFAPFPREGSPGELERSLAAVERILEGGLGEGGGDGGGGGDGVGRGGRVPVGTVIVEPVQGRAGIRIPPPGFLSGLVERARHAGAVVVFDEIFTGMGRTGRTFAFQHEGAEPDILILGKALGGGMPLSACLGSPEIMEAWPESRGEALHTSTFLGHPLSCAAALAFLDVLEDEDLADSSARLGELALSWLRDGVAGVDQVSEVRGRGLAIGVDFRDPETGRPIAGAGARVAEEALARGVLVLPAGPEGEVVELAPPAIMSEAGMRDGLNRLGAAIEAVFS
jgi:4-aminobutyrate aminotransferase-like enzyme